MAFADYVQSAGKDAGSTTSSNLVFGSPVAAGNTIVVVVRRSTGTVGTVTVTDDVNAGSYTQDQKVETGDPHGLYVFRKSNVLAGTTTVTVTFDTAKGMRWAQAEYVGNFVVDGTPPAATGSSTTPNSGSQSTTASDCIVGGISDGGGTGSITPGSGWTARQSVAVPVLVSLFDRNGAQAASSYSLSATFGSTDTWGAIMVAYSAAGGAGAPETGLDRRRFVPPGRRAPNTMRAPVRSAGVSSQTFTLNVGGSITPAGDLAKSTAKPLAGSSTASGALAKLAGKAFGGSSTFTGNLARLTSKAFAGSSTITGALALTRVILRSFGGSITPAGTLARQTNKSLAGSSTGAGALTRQTGKALAGSSTPAGALAKLVGKAFAGTSTPTGALAVARVILRAFGGSITASGALTRSTGKALAGTSTPAGALAKSTSKQLAGSITSSGALAKLARKAFAGVLTLAGALTNQFSAGGAPQPSTTFHRRTYSLDNRRTYKPDNRRTYNPDSRRTYRED